MAQAGKDRKMGATQHPKVVVIGAGSFFFGVPLSGT